MAEDLPILCLIAVGSAVLPFVARRLNVPSAVLEIIYGMLLFNSILHERPGWFGFMKELGFLYLMFVAGMELDIRELLKGTKVCWYLVIPGLSLLLTPLFFIGLGHPYYIGVALSVMSAGIIFPVLKETALSRTEFGRHAIGVALAGELLSIIMLTGLDIYQRYGFSVLSLLHGIKLLALLLAAGVILKVMYLFAWWHPEKVSQVMESNDPVEEGIRIALSIVAVGALIAYGAQVEPITGAFMAGTMFTFVFRSKGRFEEKINALGFGFFIPFFFLGIGAEFDTTLFLSVRDVAVALLMVGAVFLSNLPAVFLGRFLSMDLRDSVGLGLLLSAPLSMIVVAGRLGVNMDLIDARLKSTLVLTALLSSLLYPYVFRRLSVRHQPACEPDRLNGPSGQ